MGIVVVSLFDGMSCGQIALERDGIEVEKYYASEIDEKAIKVTQHNYPSTIQLGDVCKVNSGQIKEKVDLLIGGSPCQGFSIAGKKLNFDDVRSKLFFEYVRLKKEFNPTYFLLENVKMSDEIADIIDKELGVKRVFINSIDFTGQVRKRYYWTNIPICAWDPKGLKFKDMIDTNILFDRSLDSLLDRTIYKPSMSRDGIITINSKDKEGKQTWQRGRVYDIEGNCPALCATLFDLNITRDHKMYRKLTITECEKLQGVPIGYTSCLTKTEAGKVLGNGWTVDVIAHILNGIKQ